MVLNDLSSALRTTFRKFLNRPYAEERAVNEFIKDLQKSLLSSDVDVNLVLQISDTIRESAREKPPTGVSKKDFIVHKTYLELVDILGKEKRSLNISGQDSKRFLFVGIQGSGKTTTIAKIARFFQKKGIKVAVICADNYRPGAYDQLEQSLKPYNVPVFGDVNEKDAARLIKEALVRTEDYRIVLIDTAGRHKQEASLMEEVRRIGNEVKLDAAVMIIDATLGQQARSQAEAFSKAVSVGYLVLTKMDGTAKGGGALSAAIATKAPVIFIGTGEKVEDLEEFDPVEFVSDLVGFVDLKNLVRRVETALSMEDEERVKAIAKGKFTIEEFLVQVESIGRPGMLSLVKKILPQSAKLPGEWEQKSVDMTRVWRSILDSMNDDEKQDVTILNSGRVKRIARGSGRTEKDVRGLIRQYNNAKKFVRRFKGTRDLKLPFR